MNSDMEVWENLYPEIVDMLKHVAENEKLTNYKIKKLSGCLKGDGYAGMITFIEINGSCASGKKTLNLVVKSAYKNNALKQMLPITKVFQREIHMYNIVVPSLQQLLVEKGLPVFSGFAKCYMADINNEALILENLREKGYRLYERRIPMDEDHVALVMRSYGRYHALSLGLKHEKPQLFERITTNMDDILIQFVEKPDFMQLMINQCNKAAETLTLDQDTDASMLFRSFINNTPQFVKGLFNKIDKYSVILHGDCWTNNMMFEYQEQTYPNTPTNVCFLDLQVAQPGPPILDISYFFYGCSSKTVLDNFTHYLDIYYHSLADYLKQLGCNPDELYPYSVFMQQWKEIAKFGLLMAVFIIKVMLREEAEVTDLAEMPESVKSVANIFGEDISKNSEWADRIKHIILHFVKNKLL